MTTTCTVSPEEARERLLEYLRNQNRERLFSHPIEHPSRRTGFCRCDLPWPGPMLFYLQATLLKIILTLPYNRPKVWLLRRLGARIGENVEISPSVWIDPVFPELLTIEDDVVIGTAARICFHEFNLKEFRAGTVTIRKGSLIGAFSIIAPGVEIGAGATVAMGAVVRRDVTPGAVAIGNPSREVPK